MPYLAVKLTHESREIVKTLAIYPELRGDHVTLAYLDKQSDFQTDWIPGNYQIGQKVSVQVVGMAHNERVQALVVAIAGSSLRPFDGGKLHITVSKQFEVASVESNQMLENAVVQPLDCTLEGVIEWID